MLSLKGISYFEDKTFCVALKSDAWEAVQEVYPALAATTQFTHRGHDEFGVNLLISGEQADTGVIYIPWNSLVALIPVNLISKNRKVA